MIIDTHLHTAEYSFDSVLPVEEALVRALEIGLDGICVTDHESLGILERAEDLSLRYGLLVLPGVEILTSQGDFLAFGLDKVPARKISPGELQEMLRQREGFAVAAHPYRDNGRGAGDMLFGLKGAFGIEVCNGRTKPHHNLQAVETAGFLDVPRLGGSDAHTLEEVGRYATEIRGTITGLQDFIHALKEGNTSPVYHDGAAFREPLSDFSELQRV